MDGRPTWTDCDEAGDYVVPNVLSQRDLVFRPDNMDETVPHILLSILGDTIKTGGSSTGSGLIPASNLRHTKNLCLNSIVSQMRDITWKNSWSPTSTFIIDLTWLNL